MKTIETKSWLVIENDYTRIVHGGRGDYIEIDKTQIVETNINIPESEKWRREYGMAYYLEFRSNYENSVKLYYQLRTVSYADYQIGFYYVAVGDVIIKNNGLDKFLWVDENGRKGWNYRRFIRNN